MPRLAAKTLGLALPITLLSQAAFADLTPADVWGDWRQYLEGMGYTINASETQNGADLTVGDITLNMAMPEDAGAMAMSLGTLNFVQNDDGSVAIVMPGIMPMTVKTTPADGDDPVTLSMNYIQTDHAMTVSGSPAEMVYNYIAGTVEFAMEQVQVGADTFGQENAKVSIIGTGVNSNTTMTVAEMRSYQQTSKIDSIQYDIAIKNPAEPTTVNIKGSAADLTMDGGGTIPFAITDKVDVAEMLRAGFDVTGKITYGAGSSQTSVQDPTDGNFAMTTSSSGGDLGVAMGADGLEYTATQNNLAVTANVTGLPFPIEASMAKGSFNLSAPISKSEEPQDFAFGLTLSEFEMSDLLWSIFDQANQLPRDPATLVLDLSGKAKVLVDILDPDTAAQLAGETPGEVQTLTVNKVQLDAAGAKLDGSGYFVFDNTDTTTFPGMPKPVGEMNMSLVGGNGLLDKLVAMGLLPEDKAMGARMMMGLFAVPGTAPDTLNSKIEFTQEGQVLANGQRIK